MNLFRLIVSALFGILTFSNPLFAIDATNNIPEKKMVIVIPSYNNYKWYKNNLNTVISQNYKNYRVIYLNDSSSDSTGIAVEDFAKENLLDYRVINFNDELRDDIVAVTEKFINEVNQEYHYLTIVNNVNRVGAMANLYRSIHSCEDDEIIVTLDGDDWFAGPEVLNILNKAYSSGEVWLTHGSFDEYPDPKTQTVHPIPHNNIVNNRFRETRCPTHLRTFYAWLFKKIELKDLLYNGNFFQVTWDLAMMWPMIEMAGERHVFIPEIVYIYNMATGINDFRIHGELQRQLDHHIRYRMPRYRRIESPNSTKVK